MTRAEMIALLRAGGENSVFSEVADHLESLADELEAAGKALKDCEEEIEAAYEKAEEAAYEKLEEASDALRAYLVDIGLAADPVTLPPGSLGDLCAALGVGRA